MTEEQLIGAIMYRLTVIAEQDSEHLEEEYGSGNISDALECMYIHAQDAMGVAMPEDLEA